MTTDLIERRNRALGVGAPLFVQRWLEQRQDRTTGAWYAGVEPPHDNVVNGIFKLFVTYERRETDLTASPWRMDHA